MERLTYRGKNGKGYGRNKGYYDCVCLHMETVADRLAAYEDTGMEPEEIKRLKEEVETRFLLWVEKHYGISGGRLMELANAEKEGRCVVLPCSVERIKEAVQGVHDSFDCFFDAIKLSNDFGDCRKGCYRCVMDGLRAEAEETAR